MNTNKDKEKNNKISVNTPPKRVKNRQKSYFGGFLWIYVAVWLLFTLVICFGLWRSLEKYQNNYDTAKINGNPDLAMPMALDMLSEDNIGKLVEDMTIMSTSRFESREDYIAFYQQLFSGKTLEYRRNEEMFYDARPVYDVYFSGDYSNKVAMVELKQLAEKDSFGFNQWTVKDIALSENFYRFYDIYIKVMDDMKVFINGFEVGEKEYVRGGKFENNLTKYTYDLTGKSFEYKVYYAKDMIKKPKLQVFDSEGNDITDSFVMDDNELRDYTYTAPADFIDEVSDEVDSFCENYVYHIYRKASYESVAVCMEDGSEAERLLKDAQATLAWAWIPEKVEILDKAYEEYMLYNEDYFSVRSTINIRKSDSKIVEDEVFECRWLFKRVDGRWQVTYFLLG